MSTTLNMVQFQKICFQVLRQCAYIVIASLPLFCYYDIWNKLLSFQRFVGTWTLKKSWSLAVIRQPTHVIGGGTPISSTLRRDNTAPKKHRSGGEPLVPI